MKDEIKVIGGRGNGKTVATIQNLTIALKEERTKYKDLVLQFNRVVKSHNNLVDAHDGLLEFLTMQCGVLYTAITGDVQVDDPLKMISPLVVAEEYKDLCEYRKGLCIFVKTYKDTGDTNKAFEEYQNYLGGII